MLHCVLVLIVFLAGLHLYKRNRFVILPNIHNQSVLQFQFPIVPRYQLEAS